MTDIWASKSPIPTVYVYTVYFFTHGMRGIVLIREKVREATVPKAVSKIPTYLTISSIYNSNKHLPPSPFIGQ
jgi:hypothetical protein